MSIVFGPIPSRRLGRSLGINNIPPKVCSYSCVYCQIGLTDSMSIERKEFYKPEMIFKEVSERVEQLINTGEKIDYLTFVPDGEPTLDINLGREILLFKTLKLKIAVITNASLLWDEKVRSDLMNADWISLKIDTVNEIIWHKLNRPNGKLNFREILNGIKIFASLFHGELTTETMLVKGMNDNLIELKNTARFINKINPDKSFILVPIRPPAEKYIEPPTEENLNEAYQIFNGLIGNTELLAYSEGTDFTFSSDLEKELQSILAVHPMRKDAVEAFLTRANTDLNIIYELIDKNILKEVHYSGATFFVKNLKVKNP
jgi:wyosine [tRNA(Phe)-imidazoG37] synthetase (radical SAM superfamily)